MKKCSWVAILDCDEFATFRDGRQGKGILKSFLSTLPPDAGSVWLWEYRFGHNSHFWDPPLESLVINSFTRRENGAQHGRRTKTISRVHAIELPIISPHTLQLRPRFRVFKADERVLVNSHFFIRSFLRFLHRISRGRVSQNSRTQTQLKDFFIWRFITSIVGLNNVEDRGLTEYADDIIAHLERLGIWQNRTERLRPYQLAMGVVSTMRRGGRESSRKLLTTYSFSSSQPRIIPVLDCSNDTHYAMQQ